MAELLPTGTVTLLLADVEGSTQLWETQPAACRPRSPLLNRIASEVIGKHDGVRPIEQGEGDSFVAAFARASDAVACALDLQRAELAPIKLRIGLHTGEVQLRTRETTRARQSTRQHGWRSGDGGQSVMSGVTEELVDDQLPAGGG